MKELRKSNRSAQKQQELVLFAASDGWKVSFAGDSRVELSKPRMPNIYIGINASNPHSGSHVLNYLEQQALATSKEDTHHG